MKKIIAVLLTLTLAFALSSCSFIKNAAGTQSDAPLTRDDTSKQAGTQDGTASQSDGKIDFGSIMAGNGGIDTVWGKQDDATKQQIIDQAKEEGMDVSFGDDGTMTVTDKDGSKVKQNADGSWIVVNDDGTQSQFGGEWPENRFTKLVPKPDFKLFGASLEDDEFSVMFTDVTVDQVKEYAEKLKANGFNKDVEVEDQNVMGMAIYSFEANNAEGYHVNLSMAVGFCGLTISE